MGEPWSNSELYDLARHRTLAVLAPLDEEALARRCEACPEWSIRDVVAHHVHVQAARTRGEVPTDVLAAISEDSPDADAAAKRRDEWTQSGVDERSSKPPRLRAHGLSVGAVATDTGDSIGVESGAPIVRGTAYNLLRTVGGRRTRAQADAALDWGETPQMIRRMWSAYG